jgi:hypothetical protein
LHHRAPTVTERHLIPVVQAPPAFPEELSD